MILHDGDDDHTHSDDMGGGAASAPAGDEHTGEAAGGEKHEDEPAA